MNSLFLKRQLGQRLTHGVSELVAGHATDPAALHAGVVARIPATTLTIPAAARVVCGGTAQCADHGPGHGCIAAVPRMVSEEAAAIAGDVGAIYYWFNLIIGIHNKHRVTLTGLVILACTEVARCGDGFVGAVVLLVAHLTALLALEGHVTQEVARALLANRHATLRFIHLLHAHRATAAVLALQCSHTSVDVSLHGVLDGCGSRGQILPLVKAQCHADQREAQAR